MILKSSARLFTNLSALCILSSWSAGTTSAFTTNPLRSVPSTVSQSNSCLFGIKEWREEARRNSESDEADDDSDNEVVGSLPIHLMGSSKVALQGEKVYLQFTEDDEVRLFQQAVDLHHGVFGLGFFDESQDKDENKEKQEIKLYDTVSIVEIQDFQLMGDDFGIFLVAQVVGRAMTLQTNANAEYAPRGKGKGLAPGEPLKAVCEEIFNQEEIKSLEEANKMGQTVVSLVKKVCEEERYQRLQLNAADDFDGEDSRMCRFQEAATQALLCTEKQEGAFQSGASEWDKLDAISWAAFSTSECLSHDMAYRLAALDNHCLSNRLQLAIFWLSDVLEDVKQAI